MAILTRDDFFNRVHEFIGEDSSDNSITFIEDMTDTYNDLAQRATAANAEDWEKKYHELNEAWKKKYRHRFFSGPSNAVTPDDKTETDVYEPEDVNIDDLFKEEE